MRPLRRIGAAIALGTVTVIGPCLPALEASATPPTPPTTATPNAAQLTRQAYVLDEIGAFDGNLVEDTNRLSNGASFEVAYVATSSLKVTGTGENLRQSLKSYLVDKEVAFTRDGDISPNVVVVAVAPSLRQLVVLRGKDTDLSPGDTERAIQAMRPAARMTPPQYQQQ